MTTKRLNEDEAIPDEPQEKKVRIVDEEPTKITTDKVANETSTNGDNNIDNSVTTDSVGGEIVDEPKDTVTNDSQFNVEEDKTQNITEGIGKNEELEEYEDPNDEGPDTNTTELDDDTPDAPLLENQETGGDHDLPDDVKEEILSKTTKVSEEIINENKEIEEDVGIEVGEEEVTEGDATDSNVGQVTTGENEITPAEV